MIITQRQLEKSRLNKVLCVEENLYLIFYGFKTLLIQRIGQCNPIKCKAICCKFIFINTTGEEDRKVYYKGFGTIKRNGICFKKKCQFLKNNKCSRWDKIPDECKNFPKPFDNTYIHSKHCTFKFEVLGELKEVESLK